MKTLINIKVKNAIDAIDSFSEIMTQNVKGSLAFKVSRLVRELNKELDTFNEERRKLIEKYALRDENGDIVTTEEGNIKLIPESIKECDEEFMSLLNTEIEINAGKLSMKDVDEFNITPEKIDYLMYFIEEE